MLRLNSVKGRRENTGYEGLVDRYWQPKYSEKNLSLWNLAHQILSRALDHDSTQASTMREPSLLAPWHSLRIIKLGSNYISFSFNLWFSGCYDVTYKSITVAVTSHCVPVKIITSFAMLICAFQRTSLHFFCRKHVITITSRFHFFVYLNTLFQTETTIGGRGRMLHVPPSSPKGLKFKSRFGDHLP
jgi:hypothetical protein